MEFDHNNAELAGYLVGGELRTDEPDDTTKELFEGDWSPVTLGHVWSMIHNGDRQRVTFWASDDEWVSYYPRNDDNQFRVVRGRFY
jgi:hypothetical protein